MSTASKTPAMTGAQPAVFPSGSEVVVQRAQLTAVTADVAQNNVGAFLVLPAGCVPVGVHIDADAAVAADVGIVNDAETAVSTAAADGGAVWAAALSANGTSMTFSRPMARVQAAQVDHGRHRWRDCHDAGVPRCLIPSLVGLSGRPVGRHCPPLRISGEPDETANLDPAAPRRHPECARP